MSVSRPYRPVNGYAARVTHLLRRLPRPVIALLAALGLVAALQLVPTIAPATSPFAPVAAHAATDTSICNSSDSTDLHEIFQWIINGGPGYFVPHGDCGPWFGNGDNVRVDTCPHNNVFSYYQIKPAGGSYGPKHYGCNSNSNPPTGKVYYKMIN